MLFLALMLGAFSGQALAAIDLVQTTNSVVENSTSISATFVTPPTEDNLLVAIAGNRTVSNAPPAPAGWTLLENASGNAPGQLLYYKIAGASESATVSLGPFPASSNRGMQIYEYSGVDVSNPLIDSIQTDGFSSAVSSGSITTSSAGALLIVGYSTDANTTFDSWTNGFVEQNDFINSGVVATRSTYAGAHLIAGAAGNYSTTASMGIGGGWIGHIAGFNPIPVGPSDYTVANTNDAGAGSLRDAIDYANLNPGANIIFDIPDTDPGYQTSGTENWWRITPLTGLPAITADGTNIDGATQTAARGNTNTLGPEIELHGSSAGINDGLTLNSTGSAISGLIITGFDAAFMAGIRLDGATASGNSITGCYIGIDALGNSALRNHRGIWATNGAVNTAIGGPNPGDGNVISGNGSLPIYLEIGSDGTIIKGNRIGTNAAGDAAVPNTGSGMYVNGCADVVIGGPGANEGNLISGNTSYGIWINNVGDVTIQGNRIGTDVTVTTPLGNGNRGIYIQGTVNNATIGGAAAGEGNVISGNGNGGLVILATLTNCTVRGNMIGTGLTGTESGLGNLTSPGINLSTGAAGPNIIIGGLGPGEGNIVADNAQYGIIIGGSDIQVLGNEIRGNTQEGLRSSSVQGKIVGNLIVDNGTTQPGIYIGASGTDQEIYHNTIHGSGGDGIRVLAAGTLINNNIITGNAGYGIFLNGGTMTESNNDITGAATNPANAQGRCNVALDAGDLDVDPLYVDAAGGDFSLTECTSPVINAGLDLGVDQPDVNGIDPGDFNGVAPDMGALESGCSAIGVTISGQVFEDADFTGTASEYDGGAVDLGLANVDVELYDGTDSYLESATTDVNGNYSFTGLADGTYKVRARSTTLGDADTPPAGGLNASVPATWPYPLPELVWANGAALYGGQVATVDDTDTGDDAGPGDTWVAIAVSGINASGVNFGFAYNLIVHTGDDGLADASRSGQGSLRQFLKNANAIGANGSTTASSSEFRMQVAANGSDGVDTWWRITPVVVLPALADPGTDLDGATQTVNGGDSNSRGPEVEIDGATVPDVYGLTLTSADHVINGLVINGFSDAPGTGIVVDGASATGVVITGCYVGTNAVGDAEIPNFFGILLANGAAGTVIGGGGAGEGNVISGQNFYAIEFDTAGANTTIQGNRIGTNATGDAAIPNSQGIYIDGGTAIVIGGPGVGEGNLISGNISYGMNLQFGDDVTIQGNWMGLNLAGTDPLPDGGTAVYGWSVDNVTVGGSAPGEGNIIGGNDGFGISLGAGCQKWIIQGNTIGAGPLGTETNLGNTGAGNIRISPNDITIDAKIGGENPGEGNLIAYSSGPGISCPSTGAAVEIIGNVIRNNAEEGITARVDSLTVALNVIHDNGIGFDAILIQDVASDGRVYQNTIHGSGDDGIEIVGTGHEIRNNIITGSTGYGINLNAGTMAESNNLVTGAATSPANALGAANVLLDVGDLDADPLYVDAAGEDFSLTECSSPAINTGLDLGVDQPDMNGGDVGLFTGPAPDMGALETTCVAASTDIIGRVFEDADFAGTATGWDGGAGDAGQPAVDVELYTAADVFVATTTTDGTGNYTFSAVADGSYKVRVRSATLGDADTPPAGGLNLTVPATWPYPLPELAWANGAALYGGQVATVDDTDTGDDAGPGDTWVPVTISGASVSGVDFGFAYNLIVHTGDDGLADNALSDQGSLRQFQKNANAIGATGGTTANSSEFRMQMATNQSDGADSWWRITAAAAMPAIADAGGTLDGSTQAANSGTDSNGRGPEIELFGNGIAANGLHIDGSANTTIRGLVINSFQDNGISVLNSASVVDVFGCYIGTDAVGESGLANTGIGISLAGASDDIDIGGANPGDGNLISGNGDSTTESGISVNSATNIRIQGNLIGTDRLGAGGIPNAGDGISLRSADAVTIGGSTAAAGNVISGNASDGIDIRDWVQNVTIHGNKIGVGVAGTETTLGNTSYGVAIASFYDPSNIQVGGLGEGEGNLIAHNSRGVSSQASGSGDGVMGNTIRDNFMGGIRSATAGVEIVMNLILDNGGVGYVGIDLVDDGVVNNDNKVFHNTIHGNATDGIRVQGDGAIIRNNTITGSSGYGINVTTGSMVESHNDITDASTNPPNGFGRSNIALDATDLNADPQYVDAAGGDFTLTECASPAINTGLDLGVDQPDLNGVDAGLFTGPAPDMGALESACSVANEDPVITSDGGGATASMGLVENTTAVTTVTATDGDLDTLNFSIVPGVDAGAFGINSSSGVLTFVVAPDFENPSDVGADNVYDVTVQVDDGNGGFDSQGISITVADLPSYSFDQFSTASFSNNDGNWNWTGPWIETDATGIGIAAGKIQVLGGELRLVGTPDTADGPSAAREVDVSTATVATLTFDYRTGLGVESGDPDSAVLEISGNGGAIWTTLEDFNYIDGASSGYRSYDISAYIAADTQLRFRVNSGYGGADEYFYADNVQVEHDGVAVPQSDLQLTKVVDNAAPGEGAAVTYTVTLANNGPDLATGITVTDILPAGVTYQSNTSSQGTYNSGTGLWDVGSVADGTNATLDLDATINSGSAGTTITNTATVTTVIQVDPNAANNTDTADVTVANTSITGRVFEDADFAGTASDWDGGVGDAGQPAVDVELYTAADVFMASVITDIGGAYSFTGLADGSYKVRVRSATLGDADTPPAGGLNLTVPGTWPYPLPEMTWGNGTALPGGQDATISDTATGDDAGPGDTWAAVTVSGASVPDVNFGFAFNLIVNTSDDGLADAARSGQGSLRQFLKNANGITGSTTSYFDIPVSDPGYMVPDQYWSIQPTVSALPSVTDPIILDGYTQPGASPGTQGFPNAMNSILKIEITGSLLAGSGVTGITISAGNSTIRGLAINSFTGAGAMGVDLAINGNNTIQGNFIGTDVSGTLARGNDGYAVRLDTPDNLLGGAFAGAGNIISAGNSYGIWIDGSGNMIQGNFVGTDITGTQGFGHTASGVGVISGTNISIGGSASGSGNLISANGGNGIWFNSSPDIVTIQGNRIGTDITGTLDLGNSSNGVLVNSPNVTIGGSLAGEGNLISGNNGGITISGSAANTVVQGNLVGTDINGTGVLGNSGTGITVQTSDNMIGGTAAGAGNVIANSFVNNLTVSSAATNVSILGNSIYAAGNLGIDLGTDGVTLNDADDTDVGANDLQNFPVLDSVITDESSTITISGTLVSTPLSAYRIEFFSTSTANPSGFGEGEVYLGSVDRTTSDSGLATFSVALPVAVPAGHWISATATSPTGDTSEFGQATMAEIEIDLQVAKVVDNNAPNEGDTVTYTVTVSNAGFDDGTGVATTDLLPAGVTYVSDTPSQGTYVPGTGLWSVGTVVNQGSASLTLVATVDAGTGGTTITNNTSITAADQVDPVPANNTASAEMNVQAIIESFILVNAIPMGIRPVLPGGPAAEVLRIELVNQGTLTETLETLAVTNMTTGPGTMVQLDGDWMGLSLVVDNNGSLSPPNTTGPSAVTTGIFSDNRLSFNGLAITLAPGDTTRVVVLGQASLGARDGDILTVEVGNSADLLYDGASQSIATWPLNSTGGLAVDGLVADQIALRAVDPSLFNLLSTRNLALDFVLPANGYQSDQLHRLNIINTGTAMPLADISRLECWVDEGDDQFNPAADILLGEFAFTGSRWELTGLDLAVPQAGQRVFVTVDIAETALEGRTIQLGLPSNLDVGIGMASENDGPIDREVVNPFMQAVSTADRVVLSTGNIVPGTVAPGDIDIPLLHLVALNSYTVDRRLVALTVNNGTDGMGAPGEAERDAELDFLKLRVDGNGDGMLGNLVDDPVLASGRFQSGSVTFSGLVWDLAAGVSSHLFITGDVSLSAAADMDVISVHMDGGADLTFENDVVLSASWPLDSGARWTVDGLVAAQVVNTAAPSLTLAAGEGPVLVLDLVLPSNGYADDTLTGLKLVNRGTAIGEDIAGLNLWRDGGDGIFSSGGGDDVDLGPFILMTDTWLSPVLDAVLPVGGMRFFVGMTVAPSPTNSATVRMAVPVNGITVVSENDGPVDQSIEGEGTFLLSSAPLLAEIHFDQAVSTVGQTVTVTMQLRNVGTENLIGISPQALIPQGDGVLTLVGGPTPASFDLAPDAANSFSWSYTAGGVGVVSLSGLAEGVGEISGRTWPSVVTYSGPHEILEPASSLELFAVGNLPFTINRGQTDVVPLTLTFVNPGGENRSDALIQSLRIRLRDDAGLGVVPAELLTRVVVNEGGEIYLEKDVLENSGDEILLTFNSPVCVTSLEPVTLGIRLDVRADAMVPAFIVEIGSADWFVATGAISNDPVTILLQDAIYPIQSGLLSLLFDATRLDVAAAQAVPQQVGEGQQDVDMLTLQLFNPGQAGLGSDIRVGSIAFSLTDTLGAPIATPSAYLNRLRVENSLQALLDVSVADHDSSIFTLEFTSPLSVPVDTPLDLHIVADIAAAVSGAVRMKLADASLFQTLDGNSGQPVPVVYASDPVAGAPVVIQKAASGVMARGTPLLPSDLVIGTLQVEALEISLRHPGAATEADIQVVALVVNCRNEDRDSLAPAGIIDVLEVLRDGAPVGSIGNPTGDGEIIIPLNGIMLQPGQTVILTLSLDLEASAAPGSLELIVAGVGIDARDQNLGLPVPAQPENGEEFPLTSGLTRLQDSADELRVDFVSFMPAVLVDSPAEVPMAKIVLRNPNHDGVSGISVSGLTIRAADDLYRSLPIGEVAGEIILYRGSEIWAYSGALDPADTVAVLQAVETEFIGSAREVELEMLAVLRSPSAGTAFCLGIQENDVEIIQPAGSLVTVRVEPEDGQFFPYWTEIGSFSGASLAASYSNFPNPFAAGSEQTTFVFALDRPATVSLRLLTAHARPVQNIITEEYRSAGLYQQDKWDGRNGNGVVIQNGVYIAELTVVYEDGTKDRQMRKVAIVR